MLGAIIGDIVGSAYEFNPTNDYDFELFTTNSDFTDDTVCTVAIADALLKGRDYGETLHEWCRKYPYPKGGYGGRFNQWVFSSNPQPYNSFGNGSAMRVSPIAMWFKTEMEVINEAKKTAECTHNHPEGIKGAQAIAIAIFKAIRDLNHSTVPCGQNAKKLATDLLSDYGYDSETNYEDYQNSFDETCQGTIPPALDIIRKSHSFEDAIRRAVSLGADADTLGAIVGSIAEHIWGIPEWIKNQALSYLPREMRDVVQNFYRRCENPLGSVSISEK